MMETQCPRCGTVNLHRGEGIRVMCYSCGIPFPAPSESGS